MYADFYPLSKKCTPIFFPYTYNHVTSHDSAESTQSQSGAYKKQSLSSWTHLHSRRQQDNMSEACPICLDVISTPLTISCGHAFCTSCITEWFQTASTCPMCRAVFSLSEPERSDSVTFVTADITWEDFVDYEDPGILWNRRLYHRSSYRTLVGRGTDSRSHALRILVQEIFNLDAIYHYNNRRPNPPGLFDHWRHEFMNMDYGNPSRIAFYMAQTGLARTDIRSLPGDRPPYELYYCIHCSRFVTSSLSILDAHRCSTERALITTHYD